MPQHRRTFKDALYYWDCEQEYNRIRKVSFFLNDFIEMIESNVTESRRSVFCDGCERTDPCNQHHIWARIDYYAMVFNLNLWSKLGE